MKKSMLAIAALSAAVGVQAEIVSPNVVGYTTQGITGGKLNCVALQFSNVGGSGDMASISTLTTSGLTAGSFDTMTTDAPEIMFYNGVGYDHYYYITDAYDSEGKEVTAWADSNGDATDVSKALGTGFWLRIPEGTCTTGSLTEAGQVSAAASTTIDIAAGLTLACNPYPAAMDFSKITTAGLTAGAFDTMTTDAPEIMIYNGVGYDHYYYITDAYDSEGKEVTAWADSNGDASTGAVAGSGQAFWAKSSSAGTLTFSL